MQLPPSGNLTEICVRASMSSLWCPLQTFLLPDRLSLFRLPAENRNGVDDYRNLYNQVGSALAGYHKDNVDFPALDLEAVHRQIQGRQRAKQPSKGLSPNIMDFAQ